MAVTQGETREDLRVGIGRVLGAVKLIEADASGSTTTFLTDDIAIGGADDYNGKWLVFTGGQSNIDGQIRQVTDSTVSANQVTLTFFPAVSNAPVDGATAELWDQEYDPAHIHELIKQAIRDVTGAVFDPTEDITLHTGSTARYDIPTTFEMLRKVELRTFLTSKQILPAGLVWDESVQADWTITQDDEDRLYGRVTTKIVTAGTISNGDIASQDIASLDLSNMTHVEFPIKVATAVASDDLRIRLSATANGASTTEEITIPVISARTETWVRVAMTAPELSTAIISVALEYNANAGANTIWIGEIEGTQNDSYRWTEMPNHLWSIDKEARDIIFKNDGSFRSSGYGVWGGYGNFGHGYGHHTSGYGYGRDVMGYHLMKLIGGDNPLLLDADGDVTEVPESYITYRTIGLLLLSQPDRLVEAGTYLGMANTEKGKLQPLVNARLVT